MDHWLLFSSACRIWLTDGSVSLRCSTQSANKQPFVAARVQTPCKPEQSKQHWRATSSFHQQKTTTIKRGSKYQPTKYKIKQSSFLWTLEIMDDVLWEVSLENCQIKDRTKKMLPLKVIFVEPILILSPSFSSCLVAEILLILLPLVLPRSMNHHVCPSLDSNLQCSLESFLSSRRRSVELDLPITIVAAFLGSLNFCFGRLFLILLGPVLKWIDLLHPSCAAGSSWARRLVNSISSPFPLGLFGLD